MTFLFLNKPDIKRPKAMNTRIASRPRSLAGTEYVSYTMYMKMITKAVPATITCPLLHWRLNLKRIKKGMKCDLRNP